MSGGESRQKGWNAGPDRPQLPVGCSGGAGVGPPHGASVAVFPLSETGLPVVPCGATPD